jgi:CDP-4-dehydro-6-deoxyglucose reductase/3-phenylpropionate/trans-cinnamate dioxygenase ferredoxin reductase subunit
LTFTISVPGQGISLDCAEGETVLDAVERAGYSIPYSCRKGLCSSCEGRLLSGQVTVRGQGLRNGPADEVLFCQARPQSDLEIEPVRIRKVDYIERKLFAAKVRKIERPVEDVAVIQLRLPIGRRAIFRAGQYLRVIMPDGDSRNYSMANAPQRNDEVELHIRHVAGGKFSESRLATLAKGDTLDIELPYGDFSLSEQQTPAILIATGTGFAPIKSIIESCIKLQSARPVHLYWGGRTPADLYMKDLVERWSAQHPWFNFTPVISRPPETWCGRTGHVHLAVLEDHRDMSDCEVYACGGLRMIETAQRDFTGSSGLKADAFFSDAFVPSGAGDSAATADVGS